MNTTILISLIISLSILAAIIVLTYFTVAVWTNSNSGSEPPPPPSPTVITEDLVLYYDFDNTDSYPSGTTVTDLSASDYTGTLVNGPVYSSVNGGILNFDGSNDYIDTNNSIASESFTINAWFKLSDVSVARMLISKEENVVGGAPWNYRMYLDQTTGHLIGDIAQVPISGGGSGDTKSMLYPVNMADNIWHYTTFSRDADTNTVKLYVDGILVEESSDVLSGTIMNNQNVWIGRSAVGGGSYPLNGSIGSILIYDRALTDEEVNTNYLATKDRFAPGTGTLFTVPSENINVSISTTESPFGSGNSYFFNGTSSYLKVVSDDSWDFGTGDFTIEWFQFKTDTNPYTRIFAIGTTPTASIGCSLERSGGGPNSTFYTWFPGSVSFTTADYNSSWIHFAIVRNSGVLRVYKNGVQIGIDRINTSNITNSLPLYFGVESPTTSANTWFGGYLTNIRFVKGLAVYTGPFTVPTSALTETTAGPNTYGGSNTNPIPSGYTKLLFVP